MRSALRSRGRCRRATIPTCTSSLPRQATRSPYRQALDSAFTPYWRLIDPYGGVTYAASFGNSGTLTLPVAGTYTLLLEGQIGANGALDYTFNASFLGHTTIVPPTGTALTLDALTSGAISTAGQQDNYVFTISNPVNLYFDSQTNNGSLIWSLI